MDRKGVVRRLIEEAQEKGDLRVVDELLADDFVDHTPLPGLPPTRDGIRTLFAAMRAAFPDLRVRIDEQIGEQDKVMTRKTFQGTHRGEFLGVPGSGNRVAFEVIDILSVRDDGRITDHRVIVDKLGLLQQLGVSAP
ncbi:MAG TPA: ester cyclase [Thermoanaerobaculia bacterium]|jgi:steroid delta-isomerase-like uncharacterized protein|nr:ester cyclase [Thermoanaerobaculia bacterium]